MLEPVADPNAVRHALEKLDETRKLLANERKRAGILQARLDKERATRTTDSVRPPPAESR